MNALTKTCAILLAASILVTAATLAAPPKKKKVAPPKKDDPQHILDRLPKGTIIERDIVYATNGDRKMLLDVYRPYISAGDPPCFIVHGDKDFVVPLNQSELLHAALKKAGVLSTLYVPKGGNHGFSKGETPKKEIVEKVMDFFDSQFKKKKK